MDQQLIDRLYKLAEWIVTIDMHNEQHRTLPKPVSDMSADEYAIFAIAARYVGQHTFLLQEAVSIIQLIDPAKLAAIRARRHTIVTPNT